MRARRRRHCRCRGAAAAAAAAAAGAHALRLICLHEVLICCQVVHRGLRALKAAQLLLLLLLLLLRLLLRRRGSSIGALRAATVCWVPAGSATAAGIGLCRRLLLPLLLLLPALIAAHGGDVALGQRQVVTQKGVR
jgi:hypothetical protein